MLYVVIIKFMWGGCFKPIWLNQNIFTAIYSHRPSYYWRYNSHCNQQIKYATQHVSFLITRESSRPNFSTFSYMYPTLTFAVSCHCLVVSNPLRRRLCLFSPTWASSSVIVGTCKCPVLALHVENTVIGLGLCGTKRTVRLQLILLHPVSSCI